MGNNINNSENSRPLVHLVESMISNKTEVLIPANKTSMQIQITNNTLNLKDINNNFFRVYINLRL